MTREAFAADPKTVFATLRALEVVGEAAKNVPDSFRMEHSSVPWGDMAGMRDVQFHLEGLRAEGLPVPEPQTTSDYVTIG